MSSGDAETIARHEVSQLKKGKDITSIID